MPTQDTKPGALAALMETAHDCGYTITIDSQGPTSLHLTLCSRDVAVPVADDKYRPLADGAIMARSYEYEGHHYVTGFSTQGMAVDPFVKEMHEYFLGLALKAVAA